MTLTKFAAALLLSAASLPVAAHAQEANAPAKPQIAQGATVYGPQGGVVGTVDSVTGSTVVVNTGTNTASLDAGVFGSNDKGLTISFTQAQLNQAIEAANQAKQNKLNAALVVGAAVRSKDNVPIGVVKEIHPDGSVLIEREAGPFTLTRQNFSTDANGLILRLTSQEINNAIARATGDAGASATASASTEAASTEAAASESAASESAATENAAPATAKDEAAKGDTTAAE